MNVFFALKGSKLFIIISHDAAHIIILYHDRHVEAVRCIHGYPGAIHFMKLHSAINVGYGMRTVRMGDR